MPLDWEWGLLPLSSTNPPTDEARKRFPRIAAEERGPCRKRALDEVDPDPYVIGNKHQMGKTHTSRPDLPSASANPQVVERATPLQAEVGDEFLEKLASRGQKNKAPAPEAGSSGAPTAKRSRMEVGGKKVVAKHYRKREMPIASGNTGTGTEDAGRVESQVSPVPKKKKKAPASSPSKTVPDSSAPASSAPAKEAPEAAAPAKTTPASPPATSAGKLASAKLTPPEGTKLSAQELAAAVTAATSTSSGSQTLVLHVGRAAVAVGETASAQVGWITELTRGGADLGHQLDYAEKWNQADLSPATLGLGMDKLPVVDPADPRSTGHHFGRLRRAVREFDTAWHDANNNVVVTLPEASFEDLSAQLSALRAEKEQLAKEHHQALDAQRTHSSELKDQLMEAELWHSRELKEAQAAAEAKLDESLKEFTNSSAVLRAKLEEQSRARKEA
nr:uncharacterized protein LOC127339669 [Lolium perenne]